MGLHIANPSVVAKVEQLARLTGNSKTAAVEQAVDRMLAECAPSRQKSVRDEMQAILDAMDRIPDRPDAFDPLEWDENGLPI